MLMTTNLLVDGITLYFNTLFYAIHHIYVRVEKKVLHFFLKHPLCLKRISINRFN